MPFLTPGSAPTTFRCRRLLIPNSIEWLTVVNGALVELLKESSWEQIDGISPAQAVELAQKMFLEYQVSECEEPEPTMNNAIGTIVAYATKEPPTGVLLCAGQLLSRADYPELYDALDTPFIIDANTFQLPDLRGRVVIGATNTGSVPGTNVNAPLGSAPGTSEVTLNVTHIPPHTHGVLSRDSATAFGTNIRLAAGNATGTATTRQTESWGGFGGAAQPHTNLQPSVALNYGIVAVP